MVIVKRRQMKKILFYIDSILRPGGAERVLTNLVSYFFDRKYEVLLITDVMDQDDDAEYPLNKNINRVIIGVHDKNVVASNLHRIKKLRKHIKKWNPDIVVSFKGTPNTRMLLSTIGLPCKKVVSVRNDPCSEYGIGIRRIFANVIFTFADGCIFQTDKVGEYFSKKINKNSKIINNPVNNSFFQTKWQGDEKTIISVGRLAIQKNHALLVRAFARICKSIPDHQLVLYGDGMLKDNLEHLCKELGIENRVIFAGKITNVEDALARASLFVLPSDFEGMPNALMEAMAVGIPCIAADCPVGGPAGLLSGELSEYLFPVNSEKRLSTLMLKMLTMHRDSYKEIGKKMKQQAERFKPEKVYFEWEEYLKSVCETENKKSS